jgi:hypothetical protein
LSIFGDFAVVRAPYEYFNAAFGDLNAVVTKPCRDWTLHVVRGRRDHFVLMSCLGIRGVSINTFIASRRWRDHVLVLGWRKGLLLFPE